MTADGTGFEAVGLLDPASEEAQRRPRKRWRLWDLHRGIHGALLALSFTDDEFRRLLRRARVGIPAEARYYEDRKSTRLNSSHVKISYAVFCLKKKKTTIVCRLNSL